MDTLPAPCTGVGEGGRGVWNGTPKKRSAKSKAKRMRRAQVIQPRQWAKQHPNENLGEVEGYIYPQWPDLPAFCPGRIMFWGIIVGWNAFPASANLHQPFKWSLVQFHTNQVIQTVITSGPPSFTPTMCQLAPISPCLNLMGYYFCPRLNPGRIYCNSLGHYYCAYWGCETIASHWTPGGGKDKFLTIGWGPAGCCSPKRDFSGGITDPTNCQFLYLNLSFPWDLGWVSGRCGGLDIGNQAQIMEG